MEIWCPHVEILSSHVEICADVERTCRDMEPTCGYMYRCGDSVKEKLAAMKLSQPFNKTVLRCWRNTQIATAKLQKKMHSIHRSKARLCVNPSHHQQSWRKKPTCKTLPPTDPNIPCMLFEHFCRGCSGRQLTNMLVRQ